VPEFRQASESAMLPVGAKAAEPFLSIPQAGGLAGTAIAFRSWQVQYEEDSNGIQ